MSAADSIGGRIRKARTSAGLSQNRLAQRTGLTVVTISSYELGRYQPRSVVLPKLAEALGVTVEWLIAGTGDGPATTAA